MRIGIVCPMEEEISLLKNTITINKTTPIGGRDYFEGTYGKHDIFMVKSGIGKVCSATAALVLALQYKVDMIINTGCAGGIGADLRIGDIVVSSHMAYHDYDLRVFDYARGQVPGYEQLFKADEKLVQLALEVGRQLKARDEIRVDVRTGTVLTGDQFIADKQKCLDMLKDFPDGQVTEMEGAAVAHVCTDFNIPCLIIRSVSDTARGEAPELYERFVQLAADFSARLLTHIIQAL